MKNISKMFGAITIIGLFLIGSMSTGLAAVGATKQVQVQPGQEQYVIATYGDGTYADGAYSLGSNYPDETAPYDPYNTPIFGSGHDYCTTLIACLPITDMLVIRVRNIGINDGSGGEIKIKVHAFISGNWLPIFSVNDALMALPPWVPAQTFIKGPVSFTQPIHLVTVKINLPIGEWEGLVRGFNYRAGFVQNIV